MSDHGLCRDCGYPSGYTRRLEGELKRLDREIEKAVAERDAWSKEAGRRGLALATYAALLEGPAAVIADADLEFSIHYEGDSYIAETIPGARAVYACTEHDDCREHPEVGVACYRERRA